MADLTPPRSVASRSSIVEGPALPLGVPRVHAEQVTGEQRRLLAALAGLDLENDVLAVVWIFGQQQLAQFRFRGVELGLQAHLVGEGLILRRKLQRGVQVTLVAGRPPAAAAMIGDSSA